jgi:Capsule polysaccharide export protein
MPVSPKGILGWFRKKSHRTRLFYYFVYGPTLLLALYLFFMFSPMYVSESNFAVRTSDNTEMPSMAGLLFQNATSTTLDAHIIQSHIASMDMLEKVMQDADLLGHYGDSSRDPYSRLRSNPTKEEMLAYWTWIVSADFNMDKGIISVAVKAYTPEMAKRINDIILKRSEELVNQMNDRAHQDALRLTREEVRASEERVLKAQAETRKFRDDKSILDPEATARGLEQVVARLESEAASVEAELNAARQVMHAKSTKVQALETTLRALREQLATEKTRLAGLSAGNTTLSSLVGDYAKLVTEEEFAQQQLVQSMTAYETARLKALSQSRYIVPFQPPTLPQESLYPRPALFTLIGFLTLLIALGLGSLIIAAIKDHMGV